MRLQTTISDTLWKRFSEKISQTGLTPHDALVKLVADYVGEVKTSKSEGVPRQKSVGRPRLTAIEKQYKELIDLTGECYRKHAEMAERACPNSGHLVLAIWEPLEAEWAGKPANFENLTALQLFKEGRPWEKFHVPNSFPPAYRRIYDQLHGVSSVE